MRRSGVRPSVVACLVAMCLSAGFATAAVPARPDIVYILCDDLGIGDVHAFNPDRGKIPTPSLDRMARQGMRFTDAHATSAVCTPSRYGILTGRYNWRSRLQKGVLGGDSPPLLAPGRLTVPAMLKTFGYDTAAFGKWHLGLRWDDRHWRGSILDGPLQHGFDHFFGIAASLDMPPFAFIEDTRFTEFPSATKKWGRAGPAAPSFEAVNCLPTILRKSVEFLASRRGDRETGGERPFFLYVALPAPHTPLVPNDRWRGKSPLGPYADYVMETDDAIGQILDALDANGLASSTLVFATSDNGCSPYVGVKQLEAKGHYPSAQFRGYKADIWDGGHRIPLIVRWPGVVAPGSRYDSMVSLADLMATCARITGFPLPDNAGEDSVSMLPALTGSNAPLRASEVQHSNDGNFAIREGSWKLELCAGSGGWSYPTERAAAKLNLPRVQLYDLSRDIGEQHNLAGEHPEIVARLSMLLERSVRDGRTTPGAPQKNDTAIDLWKASTTAENTTGD